MTGGGIDGHSWRGGAEQGGPLTSPAAVNKGELQQADQHLRENFVLFLYVPTEQVGVIIGKKGAKIQYIQTATNTRVVMAANASKEWESAWFQVMVKGSPSGCYAASKIIASLVDELDDCVAQFHLNRGKHTAIIGKSGATIRRISADTNVRIFVPGRKEDGSDIQLEGDVSNVMKALALIMTAVYGAASGSGGKKAEQDAGAVGDGEGDKPQPGEGKQGKQPQKKEKQQQQQQQQAPEEPAEPEGPVLEELLMVPLRQLRLLTQNKKGSAMAVISRLTGAKITKEPKPKDAAAGGAEREEGAEEKQQGEGADMVSEEERLVKVHVASVDEAKLRAAVEALKRVAEGAALSEAEEALRAQGFTGSGGGSGGGKGGGDKKKGKSGGKGKGKGGGGKGGVSGAAAAPAQAPAASAAANGPPPPAPEAGAGSGSSGSAPV